MDQKAYGHHAKYPSATCTEDNTCTSCGEVLEKATGHRWDIPKATCTQAQKCTKCGAKGEKATGHHFEEVKSLYVEPTCGKGGSKTFKCTDCGLTAGENIEPTNSHKWEEIERHLPTVTANGYVLYHCPGCDLEDKRTLRSLGELKVDQTELYFSEVADSRVIKLLSLYKDSTIEVVTDEASSSWLSVEQSSGTDTYTVKAANNDAEIDRSAQITFRDTLYNREARVNVKQSTQPGCRIIFVTGESGDNANITRTVARGSSLEGIFPADPKSPDYFRFDGWYSMIPGTSMKATQYTSNSVAPNVAELKLYATWIEKKYYIVYDGNGQTSGAMARTKATCLKNVTLAENQFKKNGYVLDSWNTKKDGSGTRYAENAVVTNLVKGNAADGAEVRLYAQWVKEKRVKVTFNVNGGSDPKKKVDALGITVVYKEPYGDLPKLPAGVNPPENKVFAGWEDSNHNLITAESDVTNDKDHVLYARWKANTYTIKFSGNGAYGGTMNSITAKYGEKVKIPECAFDGGVGFECWNTQRDGYGEHFKGGKTYNALITDTSVDSITLYAIWTEYRFTVKYVDPFYSSNVIETVPASKVGHVYRLREAWEINGLKFLGWSRDFGGIIKSSHDRSKIIGAGEPVFFETGFWDSNIRTFYPVYESQDKNKIALIYHTNGGSTPSKVEYLEKKKDTYWLPDLNDYDKNTKPKKSGYEFCGWSKNSYGSPRTYFVETTADTEYISLYAIWSPKTWVKLTLDYGYDNKTGEVTPTGFGEYILPGAERDDYLFEGWLAEDGTLYKKGYELRDLETDTTLKAQWTRRTYNVEFYDRGTEKLLYSKTYRSDQKLDFTPDTDIVGKNFDGWEYKSKHYDSNAKVSEFVNMKTPIAINLVDLEKPYKLYAHYDGVRKDGYITVYYHMNGEQVTGGPTGPTFTPKTTGYIGIKTSPDAPSRPGLEFLGWSAYPGGSYCKAGETLTYPIYQDANSQLTEITLYARWGSKYKIILDSNGYKDAKKDTIKIEARPGSEVELKKYKKSFGDPKGYTLIGWGVTQNEVALSVDGVFTVPENDVTLYAIWNADTYTVRFRNAYGKEIARADIQYGKPFRICDLNIPRTELGIDGYSLSGWKYCDNTSGYYKNVSETDEITITRETWFVATYSELPGVDGKVIIDYLPGGGVGGPGTVEYEPGECDIDMTAPRRDGYRFAGWAYFQSTNIGVNLDSVTPIVNFAAGRNHTLTGKSGQRIRLIAVWVRKDSVSFNTIQDELDYEYGPGAFGEERLLRNYVSPDWEKLNDTTYYVIRTWRGSSVEDFESTVMVMQYDNGGWNLKAYGTLEGIWTNIRLNILTSQKNTSAKILDHTFEVVNTAAELGISFYCAPAGMIISGVHYLAKAHEIAIQNAAYHDLYNAVCEAADDEVKDKLNEKIESAIFGLALENLLKSKNLSEKQLEVYTGLAMSLFNETATAIKDDSENMDPYGDYDYAFGLFKERVASQYFSQTIVDHTYEPINKVYQYVNTHVTGF